MTTTPTTEVRVTEKEEAEHIHNTNQGIIKNKDMISMGDKIDMKRIQGRDKSQKGNHTTQKMKNLNNQKKNNSLKTNADSLNKNSTTPKPIFLS